MFDERVLLGCCVLIVGLYPLAEAVVNFTVKPSNPTYVSNGSTAKLVWDYSDPNSEVVAIIFKVLDGIQYKGMLVKLNGVVRNHSELPATYQGRVRIEGKATLVIERITPRDMTFFKCEIQTDSDQGSAVQLIVAEIPRLRVLSVRDRYEEGSLVNITCKSDGKPEAMVEWWQKGRLQGSGKTKASMIFPNVSRNDDGNYSCRASNSVGWKESHFALVVIYPPTVQDFTASSNKSWIGQTVTLTCISDGHPTPTLTWSYPDGRGITSVTAKKRREQVILKHGHDFGDYKCTADNGLRPSDYRIIWITQIKKPGQTSIISTEADVHASSLTVRWTAPADDGGSPITAYRVIILKGDTKIGGVNITGLPKTNHIFSGLERETNYTVKVFARNYVFEGDAALKTLKTKFEVYSCGFEFLPSELV